MSFTRLAAVLCAVAGSMPCQQLFIPFAAVPGATLSGTYVHAGYPSASHPYGSSAVILTTTTGDLITPRFNQWFHTWGSVSAGQSEAFTMQVPASGPGSSGSFAVVYPWGGTGPLAAARLDVGTPTPGFPAIHALSPQLQWGWETHDVFTPFGVTTPSWSFVNTSASPFTFGAADSMQIFFPGSPTPVASTNLAGITVPAGRAVSVALPLAGLTPAPYQLVINWIDPIAGAVARTFGIRNATGLDLHLPGGHALAIGTSISAFAISEGIPYAGPTAPPSHALVVSLTPGVASMPNGMLAPLGIDQVVIASLSNSLFGLIANGGATAIPITPYAGGCYCGPGGGGVATYPFQTPTMTLSHPNVGGLAGTVLQVAVVFRGPTVGQYTVSQAETIVLQ